MVVHNLNINSKLSAPDQRKKAIRAGLYQFQRAVEMTARWNDNLEDQFLRLACRIGQLGITNSGAAATMKHRLRELAAFRI